MLDHLYLIPLLPFLATAFTAFLKRPQRSLSSGTVILAMSVSCVLAQWALWTTITQAHHGEVFRHATSFEWLRTGTQALQLGLVLDPLSASMVSMVTFVGLLIFIYSTGYMHEDKNYTRFFCFLSLFGGSMLGLVLSNSLVLMFIFWELVGVCSYALIGFWYHKPSAAEAAKKAFITTRIGDVGFFIGLLYLYAKSGNLMLFDSTAGLGVLDQANLAKLEQMTVTLPLFGVAAVSTVIALLLFCGAMGKSAQFPLHVWLPDAMEGPTSVSALIHAATMVAAGVFMIARMFPIFALGTRHGEMSTAMTVVASIGSFTALFAALIAVAQNDIKRVLAYSTISQLGYMVTGLGLGSVASGFFHLITHAFFKALLFLGSGSVIHGCHGEQDMLKMGGLRKTMPTTAWTYFVGTLALAGIFPLSGFWSKDEILLYAYHQNKAIYFIGSAGAFLTAFYMCRQIVLVFFGKQRSHDFHAHESPGSMLWPLRILAFFAITLGIVGCPYYRGNLFHHFISPEHHGLEPSMTVMLSSTVIALSGLILGFLVYGRSKAVEKGTDPLRNTLGLLHIILENKFYFDELYRNTALRAANFLASFFRAFDQLIIDGILHTVGFIALTLSTFNQWCDNFFINGGFDRSCSGILRGGETMSALQTGRIQDYLRFTALGTVFFYLAYMITLILQP
ncbi:MAG: NADH-quinone oxidoreductase subunit L [Candidatus Omnitrophica bacterium]|nr:NADH-quinone oxidoreductase subunit L [Candidatus Omnitrophota bacterium]